MNMDKINLDTLSDLSPQDVIKALGLGPRFRDYALPALGLLSVGLMVGAGTALLFAPKSGAKLRADISDEVRTRLDAIEKRLHSMTSSDEGERAADDDVVIEATKAKAA